MFAANDTESTFCQVNMTCSDFCMGPEECGCSAGRVLGDDGETCAGNTQQWAALKDTDQPGCLTVHDYQ